MEMKLSETVQVEHYDKLIRVAVKNGASESAAEEIVCDVIATIVEEERLGSERRITSVGLVYQRVKDRVKDYFRRKESERKALKSIFVEEERIRLQEDEEESDPIISPAELPQAYQVLIDGLKHLKPARIARVLGIKRPTIYLKLQQVQELAAGKRRRLPPLRLNKKYFPLFLDVLNGKLPRYCLDLALFLSDVRSRKGYINPRRYPILTLFIPNGILRGVLDKYTDLIDLACALRMVVRNPEAWRTSQFLHSWIGRALTRPLSASNRLNEHQVAALKDLVEDFASGYLRLETIDISEEWHAVQSLGMLLGVVGSGSTPNEQLGNLYQFTRRPYTPIAILRHYSLYYEIPDEDLGKLAGRVINIRLSYSLEEDSRFEKIQIYSAAEMRCFEMWERDLRRGNPDRWPEEVQMVRQKL